MTRFVILLSAVIIFAWCTPLLFSLSLLIGASWGAKMREHATLQEQREHVLMQRAYIEAEVNGFREALGLPPLAEARDPAEGR